MPRVKTFLWINAFLNASLSFGGKHVCREMCFSYLLSTCFHSHSIETIVLIQFFILDHSDNF